MSKTSLHTVLVSQVSSSLCPLRSIMFTFLRWSSFFPFLFYHWEKRRYLLKRSIITFRLAFREPVNLFSKRERSGLILTRIDRGKSKEINGSIVIFTNSGPKKFCKSHKYNKLFLLFILGLILREKQCKDKENRTAECGPP